MKSTSACENAQGDGNVLLAKGGPLTFALYNYGSQSQCPKNPSPALEDMGRAACKSFEKVLPVDLLEDQQQSPGGAPKNK